MYRLILRRSAKIGWARLNTREVEKIQYGDEARLIALGETALAGEYRSRREILGWFALMYELMPDIHFEVLEMRMSGRPWHTVITVRYRATAASSSYEGVSWMHVRWTKIVEERLYPDTQGMARTLEAAAAAR